MARPKGSKDTNKRTRRTTTELIEQEAEAREVNKVLSLKQVEEKVSALVETASGFYERNESLKTYMKFADLKLRIYQGQFKEELMPDETSKKIENVEESLEQLDENSLAELVAAMKEIDPQVLN